MTTTFFLNIFPTRADPIRKQPVGQIENTFGVVGGESVQRTFECREGCSGCGPRTITTLTDFRVITRQEQSAGCCTKSHFDTTLFLKDLSVMGEAGLINSCNCCTCDCFSGGCCGDRPKHLQLYAGGVNIPVKFKKEEAESAAGDITGAAIKAKMGKY